jgi:hypothetical protein
MTPPLCVHVQDAYYRRLTPAQRDELHAWVDTFGAHRRTVAVRVVGEGEVEALELELPLRRAPDGAGAAMVTRRYRPASPPPWFGWPDG